jgi:hypothetical protein
MAGTTERSRTLSVHGLASHYNVSPDEGLSPLGWKHISLTGDCIRNKRSRSTDSQLRPLRPPPSRRAAHPVGDEEFIRCHSKCGSVERAAHGEIDCGRVIRRVLNLPRKRGMRS